VAPELVEKEQFLCRGRGLQRLAGNALDGGKSVIESALAGQRDRGVEVH
jgi:hypothetical protein